MEKLQTTDWPERILTITLNTYANVSYQENCILDLLSEIQLSNKSLFESGLLQRAIKALPSGGKFYYIGPEFSSPEEQVTFEAELYKIAGHISLETIYCGERS